MIIGYGIRDPHINGIIEHAAVGGSVEVFIIDPQGFGAVANSVQQRLIGASRRSLQRISGSDPGEHAKIMKFFA